MAVSGKIKTIDDNKIKQNKAQNDLDTQTAEGSFHAKF